MLLRFGVKVKKAYCMSQQQSYWLDMMMMMIEAIAAARHAKSSGDNF